MTEPSPAVELRDISKFFGTVVALDHVSIAAHYGEVHCLLGDNGAGKSTLIKIISGVFPPDRGEYLFEDQTVRFSSPRDALDLGIATVYQDLAMIPLMSISRNFFLGSEPTKGWGPFKRFDTQQAVGTLSGGERQSIAIARAVYNGAKVLILDEPTAALGVKEAGVVLRYIAQARARGIAVIFITHNVHHAYPIGDRFTILNRGSSYGTFLKRDVTREQVVEMMAGGQELEELGHELEEFARLDGLQAELRAGQAIASEGRAHIPPPN
jgi:simple sugar transport system ATP-binding protein